MTPATTTAIAPRAACLPLWALRAGARQLNLLGPFSVRLVVDPGLLRP
ncbi:hypothetical protein [Streptomyces sp. NPDC002746]